MGYNTARIKTKFVIPELPSHKNFTVFSNGYELHLYLSQLQCDNSGLIPFH